MHTIMDEARVGMLVGRVATELGAKAVPRP
jgi:hypothetical protein